jgi:hypothetical protein
MHFSLDVLDGPCLAGSIRVGKRGPCNNETLPPAMAETPTFIPGGLTCCVVLAIVKHVARLIGSTAARPPRGAHVPAALQRLT